MTRRALMLAVSVLLVLPVVLLALLSVSRHWSWPVLLPHAWQWTQWRELLAGQADLCAVLLRSLGISVSVGLLATGLAFPTSRAVARHRQRGRLLALSHIPFALSPVVLGVALLYGFMQLGLAGHIIGVVAAQLIFAYAYAVILLSGFWNERVHALAALAGTLHANRWQVWRHVLFPVARPMLGVCFFQTFLVSWFDYALVLLIGGGQVTTLTMRLYGYFGSGDLRLAATCALLLLLPPLVALVVHHRLPATAVAVHFEVSRE
ncbi:ABC transporter permease subunit [Oleiagrimonas sp.]|jgi:putative spermidine/putrescine transport system permease protein|uniref:ABC transporter permease n=1 Tax=Oleiagrimonas sp. TaxID=2010330 RepID=UPI002626BEB8|nr:ABC transporter permease subunit [Oleiagrimonas sp.]MDA3914072.1 ABC transporter permease subunit [Oleiagrimonas sp.]